LRKITVIATLLLMCAPVFAQDQSEHGTSAASQHSANSQHERCGLKKLDQCLKDLAHDQAGIWTSPLRVNSHDAIWLVPFAGAAGAAIAYDQDALRQVGTGTTLRPRRRSRRQNRNPIPLALGPRRACFHWEKENRSNWRGSPIDKCHRIETGGVRLVKNLSVQRSVSDAKSYGRRGREVRREKRNMPFREWVEP
jgi:hypothetical protein